jgi:hypothetical protein
MWSTVARYTLLVSLLWLPAKTTSPKHVYHVEVVELNYVHEKGTIRLTQYIYVDWHRGKRIARGWCLAKHATHDITHRTISVNNGRDYEVRYVLFVVTSSNFDNEIVDRCHIHRLKIPGHAATVPSDL